MRRQGRRGWGKGERKKQRESRTPTPEINAYRGNIIGNTYGRQ